jgi:hypothetical protein
LTTTDIAAFSLHGASTTSVGVIITKFAVCRSPVFSFFLPGLLTPHEYTSKLEALPTQGIQLQDSILDRPLLLTGIYSHLLVLPKQLTTDCAVYHVLHRNKGGLVEKIKATPQTERRGSLETNILLSPLVSLSNVNVEALRLNSFARSAPIFSRSRAYNITIHRPTANGTPLDTPLSIR